MIKLYNGKEEVRVFLARDIPHDEASPVGLGMMSVYRNVLIAWGDEPDEVLLKWLDYVPCVVLENLLMVRQQDDELFLVWRRKEIPLEYRMGDTVISDDGYVWTIVSSRVL